MPFRSPSRTALSLVTVVASVVTAGVALAQRPGPRGAPSRPGDFTPEAIPAAPHVDEPLIPFVPAGLTSGQAAKRAMETSYTARAAEETEGAFEARTTQAKLDYLPSLVASARYTRLSNVTPPVGTRQTLETDAAAGTTNPSTIAIAPRGFPVFFNNFLLQADLTVPITDYFLKINRALTAATHSQESARFDVLTALAMASFSAKQAYFGWLRAKGQLLVAEQTLAVAQAHANDTKLLLTAGAVTPADVLRAQAVVAASELSVQHAKARASSSEWALRTQIHDETTPLNPGESLEEELPAASTGVQPMLREAFSKRPELKSLEKSALAAKDLGSVARAAQVPAVSAFAQALYANPNARKFPLQQTFFPSWSAGVQLVWSPRDYFGAGAAGTELDRREAAFTAQKNATKDQISREVVDAINAVVEADAGVRTTVQQLDNAREAHRVSRQLYTAGRTTGTTLLDAEFALAQARFDHVNARVDARLARAQLEHALGRDVTLLP